MNPTEEIEINSKRVQEKFSFLNIAQINWKAEPTRWSIGQCLDHLIVSNTSYFPAFEKLISHSYRLSFFQKLSPFKKLAGPLMIRSLGPNLKRKLGAPKIFEPSSSNIPADIVQSFLKHQQTLKTYFRQLMNLDTKNLVMASPVTAFITYTLHDAMQILIVHEQRHILQAENVLNHPNFPK
jgi:hypothetical protein